MKQLNANASVFIPTYNICAANHTRVYSNHCSICDILQNLRRYDKNTQCLETHIPLDKTKFLFQCSSGHIFMDKSGREGCLVCRTDAKLKRMGLIGICGSNRPLLHERSKIRVRCGKVRHNPECTNAACAEPNIVVSGRTCADNCTNFTTCKSDFYITPRHLKSFDGVFSCYNLHSWGNCQGVFNTIGIFETIYDVRFDDILELDLLVTGYNKTLAIAFTHLDDNLAARSITTVAKKCKSLNITFIEIPKGNFGDTCLYICEKVGASDCEIYAKLKKMKCLGIAFRSI